MFRVEAGKFLEMARRLDRASPTTEPNHTGTNVGGIPEIKEKAEAALAAATPAAAPAVTIKNIEPYSSYHTNTDTSHEERCPLVEIVDRDPPPPPSSGLWCCWSGINKPTIRPQNPTAKPVSWLADMRW